MSLSTHFLLLSIPLLRMASVKMNRLAYNTCQQNLTVFSVPRTSIGELSTTFYVEFSYYNYKLEGRGFDSLWCHWIFSLK